MAMTSGTNLETGLNTLKSSQLMGDQDFQDMYGAIEHHHREMKLAHLTGMATDLMKQFERDTKFYHILMKMLCEVSERATGSRQADLGMVYSWFLSNRRAQQPKLWGAKSQGSKIKSKKTAEASSARTRQRQLQLDDTVCLGPSQSLHFSSTPRDDCVTGEEGFSTQWDYSRDDCVTGEKGFPAHWEYSRSPSPAWDQKSASLANAHNDLEKFEVDHDIVDQYNYTATHQREAGVGSSAVRPPQERISAANTNPAMTDLEDCCTSALPSNIKHPVPSLVNPHTTMMTLSDIVPEQDTDQPSFRMHTIVQDPRHKKVSFRPVTAPVLRSARKDSQQELYQNKVCEQELRSRLSCVHRSGRPVHEVLCATDWHDGGRERPGWNNGHTEQGTAHRAFKKRPKSAKDGSRTEFISSQTLEDFYRTTELLYPLRAQRQPRRVSCKSAPPQGRSVPRMAPLGQTLHYLEKTERMNMQTKEEVLVPDLKINTVMSMLDAVTSDMTHYKDKVAAPPKPGFPQPVTPSPPGAEPRTRARPRSSPAPRRITVGPPPSVHIRPCTADAMKGVDNLPEGVQEILMPMPSLPSSRPKSALRHSTAATSKGKMTCQAVDWRGKVSPDAQRHRWGKTGLNGHSYVQTLKQRRQRDHHSKKRPHTAPAARFQENQERSKAAKHRPSTRESFSHGSQKVDQSDVDKMMIIQPLGGTSEDPRDWYIDATILARLGQYTRSAMSSCDDTLPTMQFLSFVTPKGSVSDTHTLSARPSEGDHNGPGEGELRPEGRLRDDLTDADTTTSPGYDHPDIADLEDELRELGEDISPWNGFPHDQDVLKVEEDGCGDDDIREELTADGITQACGGSSLQPEHDYNLDQPDQGEKENLSTTDHLGQRVTVDDLDDRAKRCKHLQKLSITNPWKFVGRGESLKTDGERLAPKRPMSGRAPLMVVRPENQSTNMTGGSQISSDKMVSREVKSGRSAGGIHVTRSRSAGSKRLAIKAQAEPMRTSPSIPSTHDKYGCRSPRASRTFMSELEHYARSAHSPRNYLHRVGQLRLDDGPVRELEDPGEELTLGTLTVCKLPVPERPLRSPPITTKQLICRESIFTDGPSGQPIHIQYANPDNEPSISTGELLVCGNILARSPDMDPGQLIQSRKQRACQLNHDPLVKVGRPIPTEFKVMDPDGLAVLVEKQREAKAAVDIQRIFRGYVARNYYHKLVREEREKREDRRKAAIAIQRLYREHMRRTDAIYNRPIPQPALQTWAKEYKGTRRIQEAQRQRKRDTVTQENAMNHQETLAKLASIGPHVNIYEIYHPKKSGICMNELHKAATVIQKHVRGMLVRKKLISLQRKCVYQGSSWSKSVREYRDLLRKVQERHGILRPKIAFTVDQMSDYIDLKRRYESVFEKKAYVGELDLSDLAQFFKECDLHPSQNELDEAVDIVFRGVSGRKKGRGLYKGEAMEIMFHIYAPPATGLEHQRKSTWMNPIIDGEEANKLIGSDCVEDAPLEVCCRLVAKSRQQRRERLAAERSRLREEREEKESKIKKVQEKEREKEVLKEGDRDHPGGENYDGETEVVSEQSADNSSEKHVKWNI